MRDLERCTVCTAGCRTVATEQQGRMAGGAHSGAHNGALAAMQAAPWQHIESYFQLAAIHGIPHMAYDGAVNPESPYVEGQEFLVLGENRTRKGGECGAGGHASRHICCLPWQRSSALTTLCCLPRCWQATACTREPSFPRSIEHSCCRLKPCCAMDGNCATVRPPQRRCAVVCGR